MHEGYIIAYNVLLCCEGFDEGLESNNKVKRGEKKQQTRRTSNKTEMECIHACVLSEYVRRLGMCANRYNSQVINEMVISTVKQFLLRYKFDSYQKQKI